MREGHVRLRGQWAAWAGVLAVNFETADGSGEGSELLPRTLFRSHPREAHCCVRCEAVLVEPKSGTYVPPTAADAEGAAGSAGEATPPKAGAGADAGAGAGAGAGATTVEAESEGESPGVSTAGKGNGNGHAPGS